MTIIIALLLILIFGVFILCLFDRKHVDNHIAKETEFEKETAKSILNIIKTIQKVERNVSAEDSKIINEHILLIKLIEELDKKGIVNSRKFIEEFNKNKGDEI